MQDSSTNEAQGSSGARNPMIGAAIAGGVVGATVLGAVPILGVLLPTFTIGMIGGAAAGAYASTKSGNVGDSARAVGTTMSSFVTRVTSFSTENKVPEKIGAVAEKTLTTASEFDQEYQIHRRASTAMSMAAAATAAAVGRATEFTREHQIGERLERAAEQTYETVRKVDENYKIRERVSSVVSTVTTTAVGLGNAAKDEAERRQVRERVASATNSMATGAVELASVSNEEAERYRLKELVASNMENTSNDEESTAKLL
jgi:hypothetical protein